VAFATLDLIEIHYLCLLLGFGGRYSVGNRGELAQIMNMTGERSAAYADLALYRRAGSRPGKSDHAIRPWVKRASSRWLRRLDGLMFAGYWFGLVRLFRSCILWQARKG
jgi:type VI protein secretion system component VasF